MTHPFEDHCWKDIVDDELLKIYEPYHRETYIGARPAVLVIDLYNATYAGGPRPVIELHDEFPGSCGINAWNAIEPTKRLLEAARAQDLPIIYCTRDDLTKMGAKNLESTKRKVKVKMDNPHGIFHEFTPEAQDLIIYKNRASIFYGTPLQAYLTTMGIDSLIVCGESTSGCVRASVVDGRSYGYHVSVVEECVFDRSPLSHKVNLFDMHHKYADVMHIDEALRHIEQRSTRAAAE